MILRFVPALAAILLLGADKSQPQPDPVAKPMAAGATPVCVKKSSTNFSSDVLVAVNAIAADLRK